MAAPKTPPVINANGNTTTAKSNQGKTFAISGPLA
jgi:hypothetical protein